MIMFMGMEEHGNPFMNMECIEATWNIEIFIAALQKRNLAVCRSFNFN